MWFMFIKDSEIGNFNNLCAVLDKQHAIALMKIFDKYDEIECPIEDLINSSVPKFTFDLPFNVVKNYIDVDIPENQTVKVVIKKIQKNIKINPKMDPETSSNPVKIQI